MKRISNKKVWLSLIGAIVLIAAALTVVKFGEISVDRASKTNIDVPEERVHLHENQYKPNSSLVGDAARTKLDDAPNELLIEVFGENEERLIGVSAYRGSPGRRSFQSGNKIGETGPNGELVLDVNAAPLRFQDVVILKKENYKIDIFGIAEGVKHVKRKLEKGGELTVSVMSPDKKPIRNIMVGVSHCNLHMNMFCDGHSEDGWPLNEISVLQFSKTNENGDAKFSGLKINEFVTTKVSAPGFEILEEDPRSLRVAEFGNIKTIVLGPLYGAYAEIVGDDVVGFSAPHLGRILKLTSYYGYQDFLGAIGANKIENVIYAFGFPKYDRLGRVASVEQFGAIDFNVLLKLRGWVTINVPIRRIDPKQLLPPEIVDVSIYPVRVDMPQVKFAMVNPSGNKLPVNSGAFFCMLSPLDSATRMKFPSDYLYRDRFIVGQAENFNPVPPGDYLVDIFSEYNFLDPFILPESKRMSVLSENFQTIGLAFQCEIVPFRLRIMSSYGAVRHGKVTIRNLKRPSNQSSDEHGPPHFFWGKSFYLQGDSIEDHIFYSIAGEEIEITIEPAKIYMCDIIKLNSTLQQALDIQTLVGEVQLK